jgi:hypothetical protein
MPEVRIVRVDEEWRVQYDGETIGAFPSQSTAHYAAQEIATREDARLVLYERDGARHSGVTAAGDDERESWRAE